MRYEVPVGKHDNRQHASPHHEVATDVKQMSIRPIIMVQYHIGMYSHHVIITDNFANCSSSPTRIFQENLVNSLRPSDAYMRQ